MHPPQQSRSRDTESRITTAARELLRTRSLGEVKMTDIAARAGVSIGGLYARFPSKDALAVHLANHRFVEEMRKEAEAMVEGQSIEELVRHYLTAAAALYRRNRSVLKAVYVATRTGTDEALKKEIRGFNVTLHTRLREAILARRKEIGHPRPEVAVGLGILSMMATLREVVLFGQPVSDLVRLTEPELIDELTRMFLATLGIKTNRRTP